MPQVLVDAARHPRKVTSEKSRSFSLIDAHLVHHQWYATHFTGGVRAQNRQGESENQPGNSQRRISAPSQPGQPDLLYTFDPNS
jgi:hypothetical protein